MNENEDLYEILQVHPAAQQEVVEAAYRRLIRIYHPDVNDSPNAEEITIRLNQAYEVLRDPITRASYDRQRQSQSAAEDRTDSPSSSTASSSEKSRNSGAPSS